MTDLELIDDALAVAWTLYDSGRLPEAVGLIEQATRYATDAGDRQAVRRVAEVATTMLESARKTQNARH